MDSRLQRIQSGVHLAARRLAGGNRLWMRFQQPRVSIPAINERDTANRQTEQHAKGSSHEARQDEC